MEPRARRFFFLLWVAACVYVDDQTVPCTRYTTVPFFPPSIIPFSCLRLLFISLLRREKGRERGGGEAALSEAHYHLHFFSCRLSSSPPPLVAPTSLQSEREREREIEISSSSSSSFLPSLDPDDFIISGEEGKEGRGDS